MTEILITKYSLNIEKKSVEEKIKKLNFIANKNNFFFVIYLKKYLTLI